jgi:uncharacterized membrane protein
MADAEDTPERFERDGVEFGRSLAYMDATFAIATTLLVTTLNPSELEWSSWSRFWSDAQGPLLGFGLSFVVVSSYWWANHRLVSKLDELSSRFIIWSLVMLAFVALVPFTTEGLGESSQNRAQVSTVVYALNIAAVSLAATWLAIVAYNDGLHRDPPSRAEHRRRAVASLDTPLVFLISIPIALLVSGNAARFSWLLLVVTGLLSARWFGRAREDGRTPT